MLRKIRITPRLVGTVVAAGTLVGLLAFASIYSFVDDGFHTAEQRELSALHANVVSEIDGLGQQALATSALIADLPDVQQAMRLQDRESLSAAFVPGFSTMKSKYQVRQFQFHLPPATSFLRVHKPQKHGDDLSGFRKTVVEANRLSKPIKGLEIGVAGLGVRGVVPIRSDGQHLGSVELGMSFGQAFFDSYAERHDVSVSVHLVREGRFEPFATTFSSDALNSEQLQQTLSGEPLSAFVEIADQPFGIYADVLKDFSGNTVGVLTVGKPRSFFVEQLNSIKLASLLVGTVGLLLFGLIVWLIGRNITQPLLRLSGVMREVAEGHADWSKRISISSGDEIGTLAGYFNEAIGKFGEIIEETKKQGEEATRIKTALDNNSTPTTVSDNNSRLIYLNHAAVTQFKGMEQAWRKVFPSFSVDDLVGHNITEFLEDQELREAYAHRLKAEREYDGVIAGRNMHLVASPIYDDDQAYVGRVTQWMDQTEMLAEQEKERQRLVEERRIAAENQRIRVALDNVSSKVMLANPDREIIYMNKSASVLFSHAEADIREALPNFDASALVGRSIDVFHRSPPHQAHLLDGLSAPHQADMALGRRSIRILANPVIDESGERLGTAVEWEDRTEEVAVEREIDAIVAAARQGDLAQRIELQGKQGFFRQLGEGINEMVGVVERAFADIATTMKLMASGDMTQPIVGDYAGTFGNVKDDVNTTLENVGKTVRELRDAAESITMSASEISSGNNNLSNRTEQQASALEETAASMEELTSTVRHNADNAQQANQLARSASDFAEQGGEIVGRAVNAMGEINNSSSKIAEIIAVIDEIAFQTNLLALNASVEAARAGEQGRGFAVVASEVRNLAGRSATAAKEIKGLIQDSVQKVQIGTELVDKSGKTLNDIVAEVKKVGDIIAEIAAASGEQSSGIDQVNQAVTSMDEVTQQNAALAEQTSAASASMSGKAQEMARLVGFFKVSGGQSNQASQGNRATSVRAQNPAPRVSPDAGVSASGEGSDDWEEF